MRYRSATVADSNGLPLNPGRWGQRTTGDATVHQRVKAGKHNHINKYRFIDMILAIPSRMDCLIP
jgi:hypothetical protein